MVSGTPDMSQTKNYPHTIPHFQSALRRHGLPDATNTQSCTVERSSRAMSSRPSSLSCRNRGDSAPTPATDSEATRLRRPLLVLVVSQPTHVYVLAWIKKTRVSVADEFLTFLPVTCPEYRLSYIPNILPVLLAKGYRKKLGRWTLPKSPYLANS